MAHQVSGDQITSFPAVPWRPIVFIRCFCMSGSFSAQACAARVGPKNGSYELRAGRALRQGSKCCLRATGGAQLVAMVTVTKRLMTVILVKQATLFDGAVHRIVLRVETK